MRAIEQTRAEHVPHRDPHWCSRDGVHAPAYASSQLPGVQLLDAAINAIDEGLMITTASPAATGRRVVYVNPAFTRITGLRAANIIGATPEVLAGPNTDAARLDRMMTHVCAGAACTAETVHCRYDGQQVLLAWRVVPVRVHGDEITHCLCVLRDVTEQRSVALHMRLHEQESARVSRLSTLGEMAGAIGNELNQPLFAILNYVESCCIGLRTIPGLPPEVLEHLQQISKEAERAGEIIRHVRKLSSRREPCRSSMDLNLIVSDALKVIEREDGQLTGKANSAGGMTFRFTLPTHGGNAQ